MDLLKNIVINDVIDAATVHSIKGKTDMTINRKHYGLSLCYNGQITYSHKNKKVLSTPDYVVFLPKAENYVVVREKTGDFPVINFESNNLICNTVIAIPIFDNESLIKDFEQIKALLPFENNRAKIMSIFYDMLHKISVADASEYNVLLPAMKYIEKNISDSSLNNNILAEQCNISEVYFRKLFIKKYKTSPRQYLINTRINKAKQLLTDGILKINSVSEQCGFSNPYHFCRLFKEKTGLTPTDFIKKNKTKIM